MSEQEHNPQQPEPGDIVWAIRFHWDSARLTDERAPDAAEDDIGVKGLGKFRPMLVIKRTGRSLPTREFCYEAMSFQTKLPKNRNHHQGYLMGATKEPRVFGAEAGFPETCYLKINPTETINDALVRKPLRKMNPMLSKALLDEILYHRMR